MDHLNKQQLVLLTILVSFVTSIATGITTVSLLDETAPSVNQTINRVVEKTIETVVPVEVEKEVIKEVPSKQVIVVREEDETIKALEKNSQSIVRIKKTSDDTFYGLGVVISKDGKLLTDKNNIPKNTKISGVFANGTFPLTLLTTNDTEGLAILKAEAPAESQTFIPVTFGNSDAIRLGQTIVAISGQDRNVVSIGIVSGVSERDGPKAADGTTSKIISSIDTSFSIASVNFGTPVVNLAGEVVGLKIGKATDHEIFKASNILKTVIQ